MEVKDRAWRYDQRPRGKGNTGVISDVAGDRGRTPSAWGGQFTVSTAPRQARRIYMMKDVCPDLLVEYLLRTGASHKVSKTERERQRETERGKRCVLWPREFPV